MRIPSDHRPMAETKRGVENPFALWARIQSVGESYSIIPAATVWLVVSSIRMNEPVARLMS